MNSYSPLKIKSILNRYDIKPRKSLGQNFVVNKPVIAKIIKAANLKPDDIVVEIGPGIGALTFELAKKIKKVIAIEKDAKLCKILENAIKETNIENVEIIHEDILKFQVLDFKFKEYKVVANIPYYITQPIIRMFLESENHPKEIILLIQKEVAQRIRANPPHMNLLAVSVQFYATPEIISYVSKNNFLPIPKVDSAIIKISRTELNIPQKQQTRFFHIVKSGFSSPRKMLIGNLIRKVNTPREKLIKIFKQIGINEKARAENLSIADWKNLVEKIPENNK